MKKYFTEKNIFKISSIITLFVFSSAILFSCSSTEKSSNEIKKIVGAIAVVGNEPFTNISLQMDDGTGYVLICDSELEKKLRNMQGIIFTVEYSETRETTYGEGVVVIKAEPVNY